MGVAIMINVEVKCGLIWPLSGLGDKKFHRCIWPLSSIMGSILPDHLPVGSVLGDDCIERPQSGQAKFVGKGQSKGVSPSCKV